MYAFIAFVSIHQYSSNATNMSINLLTILTFTKTLVCSLFNVFLVDRGNKKTKSFCASTININIVND